MDWKRITVHHLVCQITRPNITWFFPVVKLPDRTIYQQDGAPPHFANIVRTFLNEQFHARWIGRGSGHITLSTRSSELQSPDFFHLGVCYYLHRYAIWQTYKKEFMLLSTISHHRCFVTHGTRLNTGWTFPVPLIKAMLRFVELKVEMNPGFHPL